MAADAGFTGTAVLDYPPVADRPPGPNPAQARAHSVEVDELMYGGAAGGGKTDFLIAEALAVCLEFPGAQVAIFRRTSRQLAELGGIQLRLLDRIPQPHVGTFNGTDRVWTLRNGSRIRLAYVARDADVTKFQGAEFALIAIDQVEQFTEFQYLYLLHRLRVSGDLARKMDAAGYRPKAISSANPGGVGHGWVKRRWIDPFPTGGVAFRPAPTPEQPNPGTRMFIPALLEDNEHNVDASYRQRLEGLPDDERRAMLLGDWNVYKGQRFQGFRTATHVADPEDLPLKITRGVPRGLGIDYGLDAPFCALWGAKLADDLVVVYRELYTAGLTAEEQAEAILAAEEPGERTRGRPIPAALDPACWARSANVKLTDLERKAAGPPRGSIAWHYQRAGLPVERARNDRLAGVSDVARRLQVRPDGWPRIIILSTCPNLIRTLPELPRDPRRPEDVDTKAEDHAYDALRYLLALLEGMAPGSDTSRGRTPAAKPAPTRRPRRSSTGRTVTGDLRRKGL